jgi:hypothetical protein
MASQIITTTFADLKLVVPHGLQPPTGDQDPTGGGQVKIPSYEIPTEDWGDQEEQEQRSGGKSPKGQKPPPSPKGPKGPKGTGKGKPGEPGEGEPEEGEPGEGEPSEEKTKTGNKIVDDMVDKYTKSHSSDMDKMTKDLLDPDHEKRPGIPKAPEGEPEGPEGFPAGEGGEEGEGEGEGEGEKEGEGETPSGKPKGGGAGKGKIPGAPHKKKGDVHAKMPWPKTLPKLSREMVDVFWDKMRKDRREYTSNPLTAHESQDPDYNPELGPPGIGIGGEFKNIGIVPKKSGIWKQMVKDWFKSIPKPAFADKWTGYDPRMQSVYRQMRTLTGHNMRLPARNVKVPNPKISKVVVFVDVSGSVWATGCQEQFASILTGIDDHVVEIIIFTFDTKGQEGPFTPKTYNPKRGGGGTEPWGFISVILATPKYRPGEIDGYCMLTDGCFANPPEGLIRDGKKWCFVMTSTYTSDSVPKGAEIIETFIDDPAYRKEQRDAELKDLMRGAKRKE